MLRWFALLLGGLIPAVATAIWPYAATNPPLPTSRWLLDVMNVQDALADGQTVVEGELAEPYAPRILYVGGSSGLFGIDGYSLEQLTGRQTLNLALHAAFMPDTILERVDRIVRPGDIVVAGFELNSYARDTISSFEQEQSLYWRAAGYQYAKPIDEFAITWRTSLEMIASAAVSKALMGEHPSRLHSQDEIVSWWLDVQAGEIEAPGTRYSAYWLDPWGAFYVDEPPEGAALDQINTNNRYSLANPFTNAGQFIKTLAAASERYEAMGARLVVVPPPLMRHPDGGYNGRSNDNAIIENTMALLNEQGVETACSVDEVIHQSSRFFDSLYHLNAWGSTERTVRLSQCLRLRDDGQTLDLSDTNAVWLEVLRLRSGRSELEEWELRLLEMLTVASALESYFEANGAYPVSSGWDGVGSVWGEDTEQWIDGLTPVFMDELPITLTSGFGYIYRSDGRDYKILFLKGYEEQKAILPEFSDRRRFGAIQVSSSDRTAEW